MHAGDGSQLLAVLAGEADEAGIVRRDFEWLVDEFGCGEEVMRLFLAWLEYNRLLVKLPPEVGSFWIPFESGNEVPS
ncbi:MAG TPA: hypothetical protein DCQ64_24900 [Candidatus Rokubacteria bacterium]|nr:hypothetical protein [Candidatus Rokubacteria bacterium]